MEVHGKNAGDSRADRQQPLQAQRGDDAFRKPQARPEGTDAASTAASDRIELSDSTFRAVEAQRAHDGARAARLESLRTELAEHGTLNTPERVEAAADRLLEG